MLKLPSPLRIGTRKSQLARVQTRSVAEAAEAAGACVQIIGMGSKGDHDRTTPLYSMDGETPGAFTKFLQEAILRGEIDAAVHSLKDLPTTSPSGLAIAVVSRREASQDCLLIHKGKVDPTLPYQLASGSTVGTSSLRREAQLLSQRPDVRVQPIRGNVPTRVRHVEEGRYDATIVARAGLNRLALALEGVHPVDLPGDIFVPAPGQGAIAVETRIELVAPLRALLSLFRDDVTMEETASERRVLNALEGGCSLPLGVRCEWRGGAFKMRAFLGHYRMHTKTDRREWLGYYPMEREGTSVKEIEESILHTYKEILNGRPNQDTDHR